MKKFRAARIICWEGGRGYPGVPPSPYILRGGLGLKPPTQIIKNRIFAKITFKKFYAARIIYWEGGRGYPGVPPSPYVLRGSPRVPPPPPSFPSFPEGGGGGVGPGVPGAEGAEIFFQYKCAAGAENFDFSPYKIFETLKSACPPDPPGGG